MTEERHYQSGCGCRICIEDPYEMFSTREYEPTVAERQALVSDDEEEGDYVGHPGEFERERFHAD